MHAPAQRSDDVHVHRPQKQKHHGTPDPSNAVPNKWDAGQRVTYFSQPICCTCSGWWFWARHDPAVCRWRPQLQRSESTMHSFIHSVAAYIPAWASPHALQRTQKRQTRPHCASHRLFSLSAPCLCCLRHAQTTTDHHMQSATACPSKAPALAASSRHVHFAAPLICKHIESYRA